MFGRGGGATAPRQKLEAEQAVACGFERPYCILPCLTVHGGERCSFTQAHTAVVEAELDQQIAGDVLRTTRDAEGFVQLEIQGPELEVGEARHGPIVLRTVRGPRNSAWGTARIFELKLLSEF